MRRFALGLLLALPAAAARADDAPSYAAPEARDASQDPLLVKPEAVQKRADDLHDAVASPSMSDFGLHDQAQGLFDTIQRETPLVRPAPHRMDREQVDGHRATVDGMIQTAQQRWDHYKLTTREVPPAETEESMGFAKVMRDDRRAELAPNGRMGENQMGSFEWAKDKVERGRIELNGRLALIACRIGEAFTYATLIHEATHAKAHAAGRLSAKEVVDGEVEAYRVEYRWIKAMDPRAERMIVLHSTLGLYLKRHPEDRVTRQSITYLEHLLALWDTHGEDQALREYIKKLGYQDGDRDHDGGVATGSDPLRA